MRSSERDDVKWPSFFFALLVDSLIVWVPVVAVSILNPGLLGQLLLAPLVLGGVAANAILYARGVTLGTTVSGFRLLDQHREVPGGRWGLVLSVFTLFSAPLIVVLIARNFIFRNRSDWPGDPKRYPLFGERTHRRRLLEAADDYWEHGAVRPTGGERRARRSKLMQMPPRQALVWLVPGIICSGLVAALQHFNAHPWVTLSVATIGLAPSVVVLAWGTIKFRSYYEVKRTEADLWTMFHATVIQLVAIAPSGFLYIAALHAADLLQA